MTSSTASPTDELLGVLCAWDRVAAHATARKYAAVAELVRRRPGPGHAPEGEARMPQAWDEFTASELCTVLAQSRHDADGMLGLAHDLEVKLPGTKAAFRDGVLDEDKVMIIARAVAVLDPAEARAAEALVLGRAGRLTPAGLRSAIARAIGHGCARPEPRPHHRNRGQREKPSPRDGPGFAFTALDQHGPPGGYGAWTLRTPGGGPDLVVTLDPIATGPCDHRFEARGHDPGVKLRHLTQVRHATCTGPACRRPSTQADFEHNTPYESGGRSCLCNGGPKCRFDHRLKQDPRWKVEQLPDGTFRWTAPSGRQYVAEPTRYPV